MQFHDATVVDDARNDVRNEFYYAIFRTIYSRFKHSKMYTYIIIKFTLFMKKTVATFIKKF